MIAATATPGPPSAAPWQKARRIMDVILHLGAHRTATTSFQRYLRLNHARLGAQGLAVWGPLRTRQKLFPGLMPSAMSTEAARRRATGRVRLGCHRAARQGVRQLLVSDENMLGYMRDNLRRARLYRDAGERVARLVHAFDGRVSDVVLSVRALDTYWASVLGFAVSRGFPMPDAALLDRLVTQPRSWRDVVADIACAAPGARITILRHEVQAGRCDLSLAHMTQGRVVGPLRGHDAACNAAPGRAALRAILADRGEDAAQLAGAGAWQPFTDDQRAALRETYLDDLFWLRAGADGLARLTEEAAPGQGGINPPSRAKQRGRHDDRKDRKERGMVEAR